MTDADLSAVHDFPAGLFRAMRLNVYAGSVLQFIAELREYWEAAPR